MTFLVYGEVTSLTSPTQCSLVSVKLLVRIPAYAQSTSNFWRNLPLSNGARSLLNHDSNNCVQSYVHEKYLAHHSLGSLFRTKREGEGNRRNKASLGARERAKERERKNEAESERQRERDRERGCEREKERERERERGERE